MTSSRCVEVLKSWCPNIVCQNNKFNNNTTITNSQKTNKIKPGLLEEVVCVVDEVVVADAPAVDDDDVTVDAEVDEPIVEAIAI